MRSAYEIDVFPTSLGSMGICLRYGTPGDYRIMIYDAGSAETGHRIVEHVRRRYDTEIVHDLISSHPHADHVLGLRPILHELDVQRFWMHRPWRHSIAIARFLQNATCPEPLPNAHIKEALALTFGLEQVALARNIEVIEPFQGMKIGPMTVMSPHRDWYVHKLVPEFELPLPAKRRMSTELIKLLRLSGVQLNENEDYCPAETWDAESLPDWGSTGVDMESSVVLHGIVGGHGMLLTGNAGIRALTNVAAYAEHQRIFVPAALKFLQVPHHGDSNHVSPPILDRLIGTRRPAPMENPRVAAFVSAPDGSSEHPHRSVVNALSRRGAVVMRVQANAHCSFASGEHAGPLQILPFLGETQ
jgi:beta-lactamase superfamily II metal-dependent hydrolase